MLSRKDLFLDKSLPAMFRHERYIIPTAWPAPPAWLAPAGVRFSVRFVASQATLAQASWIREVEGELRMCAVVGRRVIILLVILAQAPVVTNLLGQSSQIAAKFNPDQWPKKDLDRYLTFEDERPAPQPATVSSKAMIAGTTNPF